MFEKKIIRMTEQSLVNMIKTNEENLKQANEKVFEYYDKTHKYLEQLRVEQDKNRHLTEENEQLKILFNKEGDTQIIKYNGKLYRIVSTNHYKDGAEETLDISLVPVREVG